MNIYANRETRFDAQTCKKAALSLDKAARLGIMNIEGRCHKTVGPSVN